MSYKRLTFLFFVAAVTLSTFPVASWAESRTCSQEWLNFEPSEVKLLGTLVKEKFFGPPGYGEDPENDSVETAVLLRLDEGINISAKPGDPINDQAFQCVTVLQVLLPQGLSSNPIGGRVSIVGLLFAGHTGHHHTDVLIEAKSLAKGK